MRSVENLVMYLVVQWDERLVDEMVVKLVAVTESVKAEMMVEQKGDHLVGMTED